MSKLNDVIDCSLQLDEPLNNVAISDSRNLATAGQRLLPHLQHLGGAAKRLHQSTLRESVVCHGPRDQVDTRPSQTIFLESIHLVRGTNLVLDKTVLEFLEESRDTLALLGLEHWVRHLLCHD